MIFSAPKFALDEAECNQFAGGDRLFPALRIGCQSEKRYNRLVKADGKFSPDRLRQGDRTYLISDM